MLIKLFNESFIIKLKLKLNSPVMKSKPVKVKVEVHSVTESPKKPKAIDLDEIENPMKKQVYGSQYDSVINLDVEIYFSHYFFFLSKKIK